MEAAIIAVIVIVYIALFLSRSNNLLQLFTQLPDKHFLKNESVEVSVFYLQRLKE